MVYVWHATCRGLKLDNKIVTHKRRKVKLSIKIKNFCFEKDPVKTMKNQDWEKVFANYVSKKGLVCRIYKELWKLNYKKQSNFKISKSYKETFLCRRYMDGKQVHEDMFNFIWHWGNELN